MDKKIRAKVRDMSLRRLLARNFDRVSKIMGSTENPFAGDPHLEELAAAALKRGGVTPTSPEVANPAPAAIAEPAARPSLPSASRIPAPAGKLETPSGQHVECRAYLSGQQTTVKIPLKVELPRVAGAGSPALRALQAEQNPELVEAERLMTVADKSQRRVDFAAAYNAACQVDSLFARAWFREFSSQYVNK